MPFTMPTVRPRRGRTPHRAPTDGRVGAASRTGPPRRARAVAAGAGLLAVVLVPGLQQLPALAGAKAPGSPAATTPVVTTIGDTVPGLANITSALDASGKVMQVAPSQTQTAAAAALGPDVSVTWTMAGTPASVYPASGILQAGAPGFTQADAGPTARAFLVENAGLLGLEAAQLASPATLELVSLQPFAGGAGWSVLFRQRFGNLSAATGSMATVGMRSNGDIAYLSTSLVKASGAAAAGTRLTEQVGWLKAAAAVGLPVPAADVAKITSITSAGWTRLSVPGFAQQGLARTRAFAKPDGTVRPVVEADVINSTGGSSQAYRVMIDALDGSVLFRQNAVENSNNAFQYQGSYTSTACGPRHPFEITDGNTKAIIGGAAAVVAASDLTLNLYYGPLLIASSDLLTSPETITYNADATHPILAGTYSLEVCPFDSSAVDSPYSAFVTTSDTAVGAGAALPDPKWRAFTSNPTLQSVKVGNTPDNSTVECWYPRTTGCDDYFQNRNSAAPWDQVNGVSTLTTVGNNANTHEAWGSFLTPGGAAQAPVSASRDYTQKFTDVWNESGCALSNFTPGGNDINAVTTGLFVGHNRVHDFAYSLGFTEENANLQADNGGAGGVGGDQEIGNVQAGAATGGAAGQYMGRDNANQIAMQDGVAGITNQYLFQPIAGAFYSPCTDGATDSGIYVHEYTHAISNRMTGGPDDSLTSFHGRSMGESWSDLDAGEYQFENSYSLGNLDDGNTANPWSIGSYTTGNFAKGIRDYAINDDPLNYSDYGFDTTGPEVHADGEIWNAVMWEVRQALVNKYDAQFPYTDVALQKRCSKPVQDPTASQPPASQCPGNRRWLQMVYDAWLMQPGATDMVQARNAMLASDKIRFGGADLDIMNAAFARRGLGVDASTPTPDSSDVVPSFASASGANAAVTFATGGVGKVFVGDYEARATPIADTDPASALGATAAFTPGIYKMTFVSPTRGFRRFVLTVPDGSAFTQAIDDSAVNLASAGSGATLIDAAGTGDSINAASLIDGTEATNWGGTPTDGLNVDDTASGHPAVAVALAGGLQTISSVKVSAVLRPVASGDPTGLGLLPVPSDDPDPTAAARFTALRKFAIQACTAACDDPSHYTTVFTSADDAFDGQIPRPVIPDQTMRSFSFPAVQAAAVRLVALENQCTGQAAYAGEQDSDPSNNTDCKTASSRGETVHAAELQVFGSPVPVDPAPGTPGTGVPGSGDAGQGTSALPLPGQGVIPGVNTSVLNGLVGKLLKTRTRIRLPRVQQVKGKESTRMKYAVVGLGGTSLGKIAGKVVVKLDGKKVKKKAVVITLKQGKKVVGYTYRVPRSLSLGQHHLQVFFKTGSSTLYTASKSRRILLTVVRSRPGVG